MLFRDFIRELRKKFRLFEKKFENMNYLLLRVLVCQTHGKTKWKTLDAVIFVVKMTAAVAQHCGNFGVFYHKCPKVAISRLCAPLSLMTLFCKVTHPVPDDEMCGETHDFHPHVLSRVEVPPILQGNDGSLGAWVSPAVFAKKRSTFGHFRFPRPQQTPHFLRDIEGARHNDLTQFSG